MHSPRTTRRVRRPSPIRRARRRRTRRMRGRDAVRARRNAARPRRPRTREGQSARGRERRIRARHRSRWRRPRRPNVRRVARSAASSVAAAPAANAMGEHDERRAPGRADSRPSSAPAARRAFARRSPPPEKPRRRDLQHQPDQSRARERRERHKQRAELELETQARGSERNAAPHRARQRAQSRAAIVARAPAGAPVGIARKKARGARMNPRRPLRRARTWRASAVRTHARAEVHRGRAAPAARAMHRRTTRSRRAPRWPSASCSGPRSRRPRAAGWPRRRNRACWAAARSGNNHRRGGRGRGRQGGSRRVRSNTRTQRPQHFERRFGLLRRERAYERRRSDLEQERDVARASLEPARDRVNHLGPRPWDRAPSRRCRHARSSATHAARVGRNRRRHPRVLQCGPGRAPSRAAPRSAPRRCGERHRSLTACSEVRVDRGRVHGEARCRARRDRLFELAPESRADGSRAPRGRTWPGRARQPAEVHVRNLARSKCAGGRRRRNRRSGRGAGARAAAGHVVGRRDHEDRRLPLAAR